MAPLTLTVSLADQLFSQTKSIGIFNLSLGLVENLARRPEVARLTVLANRSIAGRLPANLNVRWHDAPTRGRLPRIFWDQWGVYAAAAATSDEWLLLPKGFASFLRRCPVRLAAYVSDTIHDHYREHHAGEVSAFEQAYFVRSFWGTMRHARVILTNSDFTRGEVLRMAKVRKIKPPPVHTIGIGFSQPGALPALRENRICVLASPHPHKRTRLAVEWMSRWQQESVFSGAVEWIGRLPSQLSWPDRANWHHHERLPEPAYRALMAQAQALVFFSDYEGFGMPPVEAALAGACPVFSDIPATREVMAGCGCAFSNTDYASFGHALDSALACTPEMIATWANQLLARHRWETVADRLLLALQAANQPG